MDRLRISAISYLNTAPLMWDFRHGHPCFDISYTVPSKCAAGLARGSADIGIIPAAAYASIPDLAVIPGVGIASKSAVRSILLVSKVPLDKIHSVALDDSSLTSVALIQILFAKWWDRKVRLDSAYPDLRKMLETHDAALVIGDNALQVDRSRYLTWDLAEEWIKFTGKPFVFAFWAVRQGALSNFPQDLNPIFQQSRDNGLCQDSVDEIAADWAPRLRISRQEVKAYLTHNIFYHLDRECLEGLGLFYNHASDCGVLSTRPNLRFLESEKLAAL